MAKSKERKRFTEQQQRAAVADLSTMTIDEAAKKHGCSAGSLWTWKRKFGTTTKAGNRAGTPSAPATLARIDRMAELEAQVAELEAEGGRLRRMLLDGFITNETNPKLKRIAEIVRDGGSNQVQEIMEALLQPELASARTDDPEVTSGNSHRKRAH
jgi:transposase-like protein